MVSILMPALNAAPYLPQAVDSILAQRGGVAWELLIVDDGSTDETLALAQDIAARYPGRIRVLRHDGHRNRGTSASRNLALRHAAAPVVAFLDADDVWLPEMLDSQLALLRRYPEAAMVYANAERAWDLSVPYGESRAGATGNTLPALLPKGVQAGLLPCPGPLQWCLQDETMVPCTCTVLVRTDVARAVSGFAEEFHGLYDDQVFYAKVALQYPVAVRDACVARYRKHHQSCCAQVWENSDLQRRAREQFERWLAAYTQALPGALRAGVDVCVV